MSKETEAREKGRNVLEEAKRRQGGKEMSNWPANKKNAVRVRKSPYGMHLYVATMKGEGTYGWGDTPKEARSCLTKRLNQELDEEFGKAISLAAWRIHALAQQKGFWPEGKNVGECVALIHSEMSKFLEAFRRETVEKDPRCPKFSNMEIELADVVIRILDLAEVLELKVGPAIVAKHKYNLSRPYKHGEKF